MKWAAVCTKANGTRVVFSIHATEREATEVVARLKQFGLNAAVSAQRGGVAPGQTIDPKARPWPAQ